MTTNPEDVAALVDAIVATVRVPAYDDMSWPEIDRALVLASHQLKLVFIEHGTLDPIGP